MQELSEVANMLFEKGRYAEALEKYRLMAEAGSVEAQVQVGWMYYSGCGVKVNLEEAHRWYLKASVSNSPESQFYLGTCYEAQKLYDQAINCFRNSADQNYMASIYRLGGMHELGKGVSVDKEKAFAYYKQAASMGHLRSQRDMALMIIKGHLGVKQIHRGVFMLAQCYYNGIKVILKNPEDDRILW